MQKVTSVILGVAVFASAAYASPTKIVAERGYYTANGVLAGYNGGGSPAAPTQTVHVGGSAGLVYTPEYINCDVGTVIEFQFDVHNHTITQSTFPEPCVHMQNGIVSLLSWS
jgi:plastocyanin